MFVHSSFVRSFVFLFFFNCVVLRFRNDGFPAHPPQQFTAQSIVTPTLQISISSFGLSKISPDEVRRKGMSLLR